LREFYGGTGQLLHFSLKTLLNSFKDQVSILFKLSHSFKEFQTGLKTLEKLSKIFQKPSKKKVSKERKKKERKVSLTLPLKERNK